MDFYNTAQIPTDLAKKSFANGISRIMPNGSAPLFAISGQAKKKTIPNIEHGYWQKAMQFVAVTTDGDVADGVTTTIPVAATTGVLPGSILRLAPMSGSYAAPELMLVTGVTAGVSLTVVRGFAGTTPKAGFLTGTILVEVGNAFPEGSDRPTSKAILPTRVQNYTQIFRNSWDVTGTIKAVQMIAGDGPVAENKADCASFHAVAIEQAAFFGRKSMGTDATSGQPFHTMDGIEAQIETGAPANLSVAGSTTTYNQLEDMLEPLFDYKTDQMNSNSRTVFLGSNALKVINRIGRLSGEYQLTEGQTSFGLRFNKFSTTRGTFNLVEHPLFNTNADWKKMAVILDLSAFDFCYLEGRDTRHDKYNQLGQLTDGKDAEGGVLTTELTTQLLNPYACGIIYNLTAAA